MSKAAILAGGLMSLAALSPASAASWGVGVEFGGPRYYGPPPVYYGAPPPYLYEQPPAVYTPAPVPVLRTSISPDAVFNVLERSGYREFSPMAFRDGVYKLDAVNRRGDLVALEVSALDGQVERELVLQVRRRPSAAATQAPAISPPPVNPETSGKPGDPLVVY